jgi:hypothetical protein
MLDRQLELSFANGRGYLSPNRRQQRQSRARWWFDRMRQTVDRALDWQPAPPPRPEQICLPAVLRLEPASPPPEPLDATPPRERHESHMSA